MKPKTRVGHDNINTKLLKSINASVCIPIRILSNMSIQTGMVPDALKLANNTHP